MPANTKSSLLVYICFAVFVASGVMYIWLAEAISAGETRPFSYWYWAFVAYNLYGIVAGISLRRSFARKLSRTDISANRRSRLWFTRELFGMCFALSPIVTFAAARILLKMPISFSVPWYALGFILFILWRPSRQLAFA